MTSSATKWPKPVAQLTPEQERIADDWMKHFHEQLSDSYGAIPRFNHGYAARSAAPGARTLEIGAGLAEYLDYAPATDYEYVALELREEMAAALRERHPEVEAVVGNAEERLPFEDDSFDRVLAIHVLEHLRNLPAAVDGDPARAASPAGRSRWCCRARAGSRTGSAAAPRPSARSRSATGRASSRSSGPSTTTCRPR